MPQFMRRIMPTLVTLLGASAPIAAQDHAEGVHTATQAAIVEGVDYRVYDRMGRRSSLLALVSASLGDEVLLVGEEHDDMVGHTFETLLFTQVLEEIGAGRGSGRSVVLSLEMFERDVQYILDEYLSGQITETHFLRSARPWPEYETRYRALVEHARVYGSPVVAANAPRRYVNRVTNEGPESLLGLSARARESLPPLPFPGPSAVYREQWDSLMTEEMLGMEAAANDSSDAPVEGTASGQHGDADTETESAPPPLPELNPNAIYSQALWDASMGHAITEALVRHVGGFVVHFAGSFHVEKGTGIPERIADYRPGTRVTSVVMTKVDDIDAWSEDEHGTLGDFVVLTKMPEDVEGN